MGIVTAQSADYAELATSPHIDSLLVFDAVNNRLVAVEESPAMRVWYHHGGGWSLVTGTPGPGSAVPYAAVFDSQRERVVAIATQHLFEWDGARWVGMPTTGSALPLCAYDESRQRLVSTDGVQVREWDGAQWLAMPSPSAPSPRTSAAFAYDPTHQRCVLYGGAANGSGLADCWSWDGSSWTQVTGSSPAGPRIAAALAFEPSTGRMIVHGGLGNSTATSTWALQGSAWTQVISPAVPGPSAFGQLAWDGNGLVSRGGVTYRSAQLWRLLNGVWQLLPGDKPDPRYHAAVGYDPVRDEVMVFGGRNAGGNVRFDETWAFDGALWHLRTPTNSPPAGAHGKMVWSPIDSRLLLWDGATWNWTGSNWIDRAPATSPPVRYSAALATDPTGGVMLFGGYQSSSGPRYLDDHWRWNGSTWQQLAPTVTPSPRAHALATLDPIRNRVVLAGGTWFSVQPGDTWEWDGVVWTQHAPAPFQPGNLMERMAWRPETGRVHVHGGGHFEWDGASWTALPGSTAGLNDAELVADVGRGRMLAYPHPAQDLAVYTASPAVSERYGSGCSLGPVPAMVALGRPMPDQSAFALDAITYAPGAPTLIAFGLSAASQPLGSSCELLVGTIVGVRFTIASNSGRVTLPMPIPADSGLIGVDIHVQEAVVDPPRGLFQGLTVSDGLRITIGR